MASCVKQFIEWTVNFTRTAIILIRGVMCKTVYRVIIRQLQYGNLRFSCVLTNHYTIRLKGWRQYFKMFLLPHDLWICNIQPPPFPQQKQKNKKTKKIATNKSEWNLVFRGTGQVYKMRGLNWSLFFFFWPLCCLFFFDIRILIAPLVSSNSSYIECESLLFRNLKWSPLLTCELMWK